MLDEKTGDPIRQINSSLDFNVLTKPIKKSRLNWNLSLENKILKRYDPMFLKEIKSIIKSGNPERDAVYSIKNVEDVIYNNFDSEESECVFFDCTKHSSCASFKGRAICRSKCMEKDAHGCLTAAYCAQLGYDKPHACEEYQEGGIRPGSKLKFEIGSYPINV